MTVDVGTIMHNLFGTFVAGSKQAQPFRNSKGIYSMPRNRAPENTHLCFAGILSATLFCFCFPHVVIPHTPSPPITLGSLLGCLVEMMTIEGSWLLPIVFLGILGIKDAQRKDKQIRVSVGLHGLVFTKFYHYLQC
jgi:hypothetical protein